MKTFDTFCDVCISLGYNNLSSHILDIVHFFIVYKILLLILLLNGANGMRCCIYVCKTIRNFEIGSLLSSFCDKK